MAVYIPKRYILTFLSHVGFFVVYALRVNLSVAMVAMVNSTYVAKQPIDPECSSGKNHTMSENVSFVFLFYLFNIYAL